MSSKEDYQYLVISTDEFLIQEMQFFSTWLEAYLYREAEMKRGKGVILIKCDMVALWNPFNESQEPVMLKI